jgi:hypothetical protein
MRRVFRLGAVMMTAIALLVALFQFAAALQGGEESPHRWVVVCHGTGSSTNPFVLVVVAEEATTGAVDGTHGGHQEEGAPPGHEGDVFLSVVEGFSSHKDALEFAHANRGNEEALCTEEVTPPGVPPANPAPGAPGVAPVTG